MADDFVVRCRNLCAGYGREIVLHDVTLDIPRGILLPFIGPNGAGKTTFLRTILGLLKPLSGALETPFHQSPPGCVSQQKAIDPLYPLTTRQVAAMGLYPRLSWWRLQSREDKAAVSAALELVGLLPHASKNYRELSGGMKQKALIARALVSGAEVLVMDEPTSELDEKSEREVFGHFRMLCSEKGKTVLMASHGLTDLSGAGELRHRALVDHGKVVLEGI
ncbi:MAG: ATP-binding cassette domain-containing protein [Planctomycetota bacterium]|nr:ATP-binding cassette domain-containing protein [Planctomycetota bacterium]